MENLNSLFQRLFGSLQNVAVFGLCILLSYMVIVPIQRLYFHPLSKFPGRPLWIISRIPYAYYSVRGTIHFKLREMHEQYGDVVRSAPNELTYITEDAYPDIYQPNKITRQLLGRDPKLMSEPPNGDPHGIAFNAHEPDHARMRRNLNPMFTESAMRAQEPLMKIYIDLFIQRLHENCSKPLDIIQWLNFVTFDITGELTFGESFECLQTSQYHFWVRNIFAWVKSMTIMGMALKLYPLDKILAWMVPKDMKQKMDEHREYSNAKLLRRLDRKDVARQDFLTYTVQHIGEPNGMSMGELRETVALLILAGSETSATSLAAQIYFLSINPAAFQKLKDEIRTAFKNESEIGIQSVSELPYILAVINEALRMLPPAATSGVTTRVTPPEGSTILGEHIAGNTLVSIPHYSAFHNARNFKDPDEFIPERWLPEGQEKYGGDKKKVMQAFGLGPRICIGKSLAYAEMKIILARLVWNFDFELRDGYFDWPATMKAYAVWEKTPLWVKLTPVQRD